MRIIWSHIGGSAWRRRATRGRRRFVARSETNKGKAGRSSCIGECRVSDVRRLSPYAQARQWITRGGVSTRPVAMQRRETMSEAACAFCLVLEGLQHTETYHVPSGEVIRKIQELPTAIVVLSNDQYYPGYTLVIAKTHATELY